MEIKEKQSLKEKIVTISLKAANFSTKYRFTLLVAILGMAIGFALLRTQSFIDTPRNEKKYAEETAKIQYKSINEDTLKKFDQAQQDKDVDVGSQFDPDRVNPFIENQQ